MMKKNLFFLSIALLAIFSGYAQQQRNTEWLTWVKTPIMDRVGANSGHTTPWGVYHRYAPEDLTLLEGQYLTKIRYKPISEPLQPTQFVANPRIKIWTGGHAEEAGNYTLYEPLTLIVDVEIPDYTFNCYNVVDLPVPVVISSSTMLWIGIEYRTSSGLPVGVTDPSGGSSYFHGKSNIIDTGDAFFHTSTTTFYGPNNKYCWDLAAYTRDPLPLSKCSITVEMKDVFNDGWSESFISFVDENNVEWDRQTINKYERTATVNFPRDANIKCIWNHGTNAADNEVSFVIKNAEGTVLYTCNPGDFAGKPTGEFFSFTASCGGNEEHCEESIFEGWGASDFGIGAPTYVDDFNTYSYSQHIYFPSEVGSYTGTVNINALSYKYLGKEDVTQNNIKIYMGHTTQSEFASNTDWLPFSTLTEVYSGSVTFSQDKEWTMIPLQTPFEYEGGNLVVAMLDNSNSGNTIICWQGFADEQRGLFAVNNRYADPINPENTAGFSWAKQTYLMASTRFLLCNTTEIILPCKPVTHLVYYTEPNGTSLKLIWKASETSTAYNVYRNDEQIGTNISTTSFTDLNFDASETYTYAVSSVCGDQESDFVTITVVPPPPVEVVSTLPANDATGVALNAELSVTFNQNVAGSLAEITINGTAATGTISGNKLTIAHKNFDYETVYTVVIPKGAINYYNEVITWSFTTVKEPAPQTYTITASLLTGGGTITPMGATTVEEGSNLTFTITPNQNCKILQVPVDGNNNPQAVATGSYTFSNIKANHTIEASFECESVQEKSNSIQIYSYLNVINVINDVNILIKKVEVIDMLGRTIWQGAAPDSKTEIVLNVAPGIYAVRITTENTIITSKVTIKL